jgi:hypothetical protein
VSESDRQRKRLTRLRQMLVENHITPLEARREELRKCRAWRVDKLWICLCGKKCIAAWLPVSCPACGQVCYRNEP